MGDGASAKPRWIRDFGRFLPLKSQFVFSGNVHDRYPRPVDSSWKLVDASPALELLGILAAASFRTFLPAIRKDSVAAAAFHWRVNRGFCLGASGDTPGSQRR